MQRFSTLRLVTPTRALGLDGQLPEQRPAASLDEGDDADPTLVLTEIQKLYREIRAHYDQAKWGQDPVGRRALGECLDAIGAVVDRWVGVAHGEG